MSKEIVTINREDYDKLVANAVKLDKARYVNFELKELIEKEGYIVTSNCEMTKLILLKKDTNQ